MGANIKHVTKVNARRLRTIASKFHIHNDSISVCLDKEIWAKRDCKTTTSVKVWCSECGYQDTLEEFIERHGGE